MEDEKRHEESDLARKVKSLEEKEESVLARAVAATMRAYNESPTTKNLKEWDAAKKRFAEFQRSKAANAEPRLANLTEALVYLNEEGWKVSQSKIYGDAGKIENEKDGSYTKKAIDEYARIYLKKRDGSDADITDIAAKKANIELENEEIKLWHNRREKEEKEGLWQLKSEVESEFAAFATFVKNSVGAEFIHRAAESIIRAVEGNPSRTPELIELWRREVDEFFDGLSRRKEYTVPAEEDI